MRRNCALGIGRYSTLNDVEEWSLVRYSPQPASTPPTQIFGQRPYTQGLPVQAPRFPARTRHAADFPKFRLGALGPVASSESSHKPDHLTPTFESCGFHRERDQGRHKRVPGNEHMRTRAQHRQQRTSPLLKEINDRATFRRRQDREARQRPPCRTVKRRRNPPDAAAASPKLLLLPGFVLDQAVWRICDNSGDALAFGCAKPVEAVVAVEGLSTKREDRSRPGRCVNRVQGVTFYEL